MTPGTTGIVGEHHLTFGTLLIARNGFLRAVDPALVTDVTQPTAHATTRLGQRLLGGQSASDLLKTGDGLLDLDLQLLIARNARILVQT